MYYYYTTSTIPTETGNGTPKFCFVFANLFYSTRALADWNAPKKLNVKIKSLSFKPRIFSSVCFETL